MRGLLCSICGVQDTGEGLEPVQNACPEEETVCIRSSSAIPSQRKYVCILGQKKQVQFSEKVQVL